MNDRPMNLLFVCTANVCRSPLAAGLMAVHSREAGARVNVASASVDPQIRTTHPTTVAMLASRGVTLGRDHSQPLDDDLVGGADLVLVMTAEHALAVVGHFPTSRPKVFVLQHLVSEAPPAASTDSVASWLARVHSLPRDYSRDEQWDVEDPMGLNEDVYRSVETKLANATVWLANVLSPLYADRTP